MSAAVENVSLLRVGMVVLRSISLVNTPPSVSMPSDSGVTSSSSTSFTSPPSTPPCTAAPTATTSSGFTLRFGSLPNRLLDDLLNLRDARRSADQHHFVDLRRSHAGIGQRLLAGLDRTVENIGHHLLEARAGQLDRQVLGTAGVGRQERQIDFGLEQRRKLDLGLFRGFLQALQSHLVLRNVDALIALEFGDQPVDDALVDVVAAQVRVAVGRLHFHHAVAHFENRNVERAAAEVVDRDGLVLLAIEAVGQRGRGRLIDDAHHFQAGDLAGVLGGLALRVVEISRNGDDGLGDLLAQVGFGRFLQLAENHRRNLRRRVLLAAEPRRGRRPYRP